MTQSTSARLATDRQEHPAAYTPSAPDFAIGLLTGGQDRSYALGLTTALARRGVRINVIGSDELDAPEMHSTRNVSFLNLRGSMRPDASMRIKVGRLLRYYTKLMHHVATSEATIVHILWNNKFEWFDRTVLMFYYKLLGKRVVLTTHNVNAGRRDANDSALNRATLKVQYRLADHIFVHTQLMKRELHGGFGVREKRISVIPFGINRTVPDTDLSGEEARRRLGIGITEKVMLFFGKIGPYKGLEFLVRAFQDGGQRFADYRLIIAGEPKKGQEDYWRRIADAIDSDPSGKRVVQRIGFVPDADTELYFKAADVLVLPYTEIFQSGVLFLAYGFGLPVIATNVGSFGEDVVEGQTGFLCRARDSGDLAASIERYFGSELFRCLPNRRPAIRNYASLRHSWDLVGQMTRSVYAELLG